MLIDDTMPGVAADGHVPNSVDSVSGVESTNGGRQGAKAPQAKDISSGAGANGPCLSWPGRSWRVGEVSRPPLICKDLERFGNDMAGRLIFGDALDVGRGLLEGPLGGAVDLVYVDPPFASQATYTHEVRLDGPADGRVTRTQAYNDSWPARRAGRSGDRRDADDGVGAYLDMLAPRLEAMTRLLAPTGSIWVHVDWRASYLVRVLLDEVLGRDRFLNEIVWRRAPNLGRQAASGQFGRTLDTIVVYGGPKAILRPPTRLEPIAASGIRRDDEGRPFTTAPRGDYSDESMKRLAAEGRVHTTGSGRQYVKYFLESNESGELCRERRIDTLWTDVAPLRHAPVAERTGFPTQKPRALLERIVSCASPPGGMVVDLFAGSGTTGVVANALGRKFVLADRGPVAINAARARLLRESASFTVESCGDLPGPPADAPVASVSRGAGGVVRVSLLRPEEPLGWSVGQRRAPDGPFVALWHSERRLGSVPVGAAREVDLPLESTLAGGAGAPYSSTLEVRAYADDGGVSVSTLPISNASV
jgi:DNA modification methylase